MGTKITGPVAILLIASCTDRSPPIASYVLPKEIEAFVSDRDICDHLRGEVPEPGLSGLHSPTTGDINESCAGTDPRLSMLRTKYANDPRAIEALSAYEWPIER